MKKISIKNLTFGDKSNTYTKQKRHRVYLGNGVNVYFSNLKEAKSFLTRTNEFLNQKLFELNRLYLEVFYAYRAAWFYLDNDNSISENYIINKILMIENQFSLMINRSNYRNGSSIVYKNFYFICDTLIEITNEFIKLYRKKKQYANAYNLEIITERINYLKKQLENYGKDMDNVDIYR